MNSFKCSYYCEVLSSLFVQDSQGFHKVTLLVGIWVDIDFLTPVPLHVEEKLAATSAMKLDLASGLAGTGRNWRQELHTRNLRVTRCTRIQFTLDNNLHNSGQTFEMILFSLTILSITEIVDMPHGLHEEMLTMSILYLIKAQSSSMTTSLRQKVRKSVKNPLVDIK